MRKGKPPFDAAPDSESDVSSHFGGPPDETAFRFEPTPERRELTPRDRARNLGVKRLFDRMIPGLPIDSDPPETRQEAEAFSAIIEKTLKRLKIDASPWLDDLAEAWPTLVSPELAKVTRPGKWEAGILYVYVTSSIHLFEIRRAHLTRIEQAVRAFAGGDRVKHVRLMVNAVSLPFHSRILNEAGKNATPG